MCTSCSTMVDSRTVVVSAWLQFQLFLLLLSSHLLPAAELQVRFLDAALGNDTPACLKSRGVCKTAYYALSQNISNLELRVTRGVYYYSDEDNMTPSLTLTDPTNFTLMGDPKNQGRIVFRCRERIDEKRYNNLAIVGGCNVKIIGITVENCGPYPAGIYVNSVQSIHIANCTFSKNLGGGLWIYNAKNMCIEHCHFKDNIDTRPDLRPITSPYNFRTHNAGGLGLLFSDITSAEANVENCVFMNNSARIHPSNANDPVPQTYAPFGHGGGLVVRLANYTSNIIVTVSKCDFIENIADYSGGAIDVVLIYHPKQNQVTIRNTSFTNCIAEATGGGLSVQVFDIEENNMVTVEDSNFTSCSAKKGGGAISLILDNSLASTSTSPGNNPTLLTVNRTKFRKNRSPMGGSAVGLVSNARIDQMLFNVKFQDCEFASNTATRLDGQGALFTFRFQVEFSGYTLFSGNEGGAMVVYQAKVDTRGVLVFKENMATAGGAVTLEDRSWFNLHNGTNVLFHNNWADSVGGAMLVNNPTIAQDFNPLYNTNCFFQQSDIDKSLTPDRWNSTVSFVNNCAVVAGAAIYATNITVCTYTNKTNCLDDSTTDYNQYRHSIFKEKPFHFMDNRVVGDPGKTTALFHDVATEPAVLEISHNQRFSSPGDLLMFTLQAFDQSGNQREALWSIENDDKNDSPDLTQSFTYYNLPATVKPHIFNKTLAVQNASQDNCNWTQESMDTGVMKSLEFYVIEDLTGEVVFKDQIVINVTCCHPGYEYNNFSTCKLVSHYPHIIRAEKTNRYVYLDLGYYAGFYEDKSLNETYFATALMPESFQKCDRDGGRSGCLYKYDSPDEQCKGNRTGFMCGLCQESNDTNDMRIGVDLTLRACKKCGPTDAVVLAIVCVLIILGSVLVLIFNIGVPNDLKGFLFFAQVVGFVYRHGAADDDDSLSLDFHLSRFLGFSLYLPICPFTNLSILWTAAFGLLPCLLAILTVTVYIISARVFKPLAQRTVFRGIWLIILFVYKYIADTVANIIKCVALEGKEAKSKHLLKLVYFYDGNVPCFTGQHLGFAIPALLLLVFVVLLGPAVIILISFKRYKTTQAFTDVITDGVRLKMRWWGGFDLLRRLMFIVSLTVLDFNKPDYSQLSLCLVSMAVLGVLCFTKPYTNPLTNIIEAVILLDLLIISFIFLNTKETVQVQPAIFQILLLLPFIYAIINIASKIIIYLWRRHSRVGVKQVFQHTHDKIKSAKPAKMKFRPRGLLVKTTSVDKTEGVVVETACVLGEEREGDIATDTQYTMYREELLDT